MSVTEFQYLSPIFMGNRRQITSNEEQIFMIIINRLYMLQNSCLKQCYIDSENSTDGDERQDLVMGDHFQKTKAKSFHSKAKSSLCKNFSDKGYCPYGLKCQFAHGIHELRFNADQTVYKTKLCTSFTKKSYCPYGARCNFLHLQTLNHADIGQSKQNSYRDIMSEGRNLQRSHLLMILEEPSQKQA